MTRRPVDVRFSNFSGAFTRWTVAELVAGGHGLEISCQTCGHEAVWTCREVFERFHGNMQATMRDIYIRLKPCCDDRIVDMDLKRDIRAWGRVAPEDTFEARVAEWTAELKHAG